MQKCTLCKIEKQAPDFRFRKELNKLSKRCRSCESLSGKASFFGVSKERLITFLQENKHVCGICGIKEADARKLNRATKHYGLCVDHCHDSGKLRGVLCLSCNLVLGHAKDNITILNKAIKYLT